MGGEHPFREATPVSGQHTALLAIFSASALSKKLCPATKSHTTRTPTPEGPGCSETSRIDRFHRHTVPTSSNVAPELVRQAIQSVGHSISRENYVVRFLAIRWKQIFQHGVHFGRVRGFVFGFVFRLAEIRTPAASSLDGSQTAYWRPPRPFWFSIQF